MPVVDSDNLLGSMSMPLSRTDGMVRMCVGDVVQQKGVDAGSIRDVRYDSGVSICAAVEERFRVCPMTSAVNQD